MTIYLEAEVRATECIYKSKIVGELLNPWYAKARLGEWAVEEDRMQYPRV